MIKVSLFFLLFVYSDTGFSRQIISHDYRIGAVVCGQSVQLLDYYEASAIAGVSPLLVSDVKSLIGKLSSIMPDRTSSFQNNYDIFLKNVAFLDDDVLESLDKEESIFASPTGCSYNVVLKSDLKNRIEIYRKLWNQLSDGDQAGLIMNWLLANEVYSDNQAVPAHSIYIRNFNSLIPDGQILNISFAELIKRVQALGLKTIRKQGVLVDLTKAFNLIEDHFESAYPIAGSSWTYRFTGENNRFTKYTVSLKSDIIYFHLNGNVRSLRFMGSLPVHTIGGILPFETPDDFSLIPVDFEVSPRIYFYPSGEIHQALVLNKNTVFHSKNIKMNLAEGIDTHDKFYNSKIIFFPDGQVDVITQASGAIYFQSKWISISNRLDLVFYRNGQFKEFWALDDITITIQNQVVPLKGYLTFHENGQLRCAYPTQSYTFSDRYGDFIFIPANDQMCLNSQGKVSDITDPDNIPKFDDENFKEDFEY